MALRRSSAVSVLLALVAATSCDSASTDGGDRDGGAKSHREAGRVDSNTGGASAAGASGASGNASATGGAPVGAGGHRDGGLDTGGNGGDAALVDATPTTDGTSCTEVVLESGPVPLDMYILLDRSASMLDATTAGPTKWDAISSALESFVSAATSKGISVGLQYFPLLKPGAPATCKTHAECGTNGPCFLSSCDNVGTIVPCRADSECSGGHCIPFGVCELYPTGGSPQFCSPMGTPCTGGLGNCIDISDRWCINGTECTASAYAMPAVPIAVLPGNGGKIMASIDATTPEGRTPTAPALEGAVTAAGSWAKANPGHHVVAVLATDGLPTDCTPTDIGGVAALAQQGLASTPSISTFVIGVLGPDDTNGAANLDAIAAAGGTNMSVLIDTSGDVTKQFKAALDAIRGSTLDPCEYQVPPGPGGAVLDFNKVTLEATLADGTQKQLVYVADAAACSTTTDQAWHFDVPPTGGETPTRLKLCPSACSAVETDAAAAVQLRVACKN